MSSTPRAGRRLLVVFAVLLLIILLAHQPILRGLGSFLVESHPPEKADAVIVLAGDSRGERVRLGAKLVADGYAPVALVSGPMEVYGVNEADLAIQFAVKNGAKPGTLEPVYIPAFSTLEEANAFAPELERRNIHKVLLVTSNFHSRRAAATFRNTLGSSVQIIPVAAHDRFFRPDNWWRQREGQKTVFFEYSKTIASWLGL